MLKSYNRWYFHLLILLAIFAVNSVYDVSSKLGVQSFYIPTYSGCPTILPGDRVIADLKAYDQRDPERGDLVAFLNEANEIWIYRVVGVPFDTLTIVNNSVEVHGVQGHSTYIGEEKYSMGEIGWSNLPTTVDVYEEVLSNGLQYRIYKYKEPVDSTKANISAVFVPKDHYFLMGDNRDNAYDSRYSGAVRKEQIIGQVLYSYWGASGGERVNVDFR